MKLKSIVKSPASRAVGKSVMPKPTNPRVIMIPLAMFRRSHALMRA